MTRFVEILHHERELSVKSFPALLDAMIERLDADGSHFEMSFLYFVIKRAPVGVGCRVSGVGCRVSGVGCRQPDGLPCLAHQRAARACQEFCVRGIA